MKRLILLTGSALTLGVAACDQPPSSEAEQSPPVEAPVAPAAEDSAAPVVDQAAPTAPPPAMDNGQLPPANPNSAESVQPESETLFY